MMREVGGYTLNADLLGTYRFIDGDIVFNEISHDDSVKLTKNLSLKNIKNLAEYEMPKLEEAEEIANKFKNITIPTIGFPMSFYTSTIFIEFAMSFVLIYFWLFHREAKISGTYPAPGTLFGAFGRSRLNHWILLILIAYPSIAAVLLAYLTYVLTRINFIPAAIITIVSALIAYDTRHLGEKK